MIDWHICGSSDRVSEKWMHPYITKSLINSRFKVNCMIDNNQLRPTDVDPSYWKTLIENRATEAAQKKLAHMRAISKGKGSTSATMKAIEREVVGRLVSLHYLPVEQFYCGSLLNVSVFYLAPHTLSSTLLMMCCFS